MSDRLQYACDEHGWCGFTPCPKCQLAQSPPDQPRVGRIPRWQKLTLLALVFPLFAILTAPKTIIEIADEWDVWAKGIESWWREL